MTVHFIAWNPRDAAAFHGRDERSAINGACNRFGNFVEWESLVAKGWRITKIEGAATTEFVRNFDLYKSSARDAVYGEIDHEGGETEAHYVIGDPSVPFCGLRGLYRSSDPRLSSDESAAIRSKARDAGIVWDEVCMGWIAVTPDGRKFEGLTEVDALRRALDPSLPTMDSIYGQSAEE